MRALVATYGERLEVVPLPPYAPELNPDEWAWAHLKCRELANHTAANTPGLLTAVRRAVRRMRRRPTLIHAFIQASELPW